MTDRCQTSAVKVRTQFGVVHIHLDFDDQGQFLEASYRAHDDKVSEDTQIGRFLKAILEGVSDAIHAANETPGLKLTKAPAVVTEIPA